jgi:hypothetical protein
MTPLENLFVETINYFNSLGVDYFVSGSTLLGLIRNNKLIENDHEIDITMRGVDIKDELIDRLKKDNWYISEYKTPEKHGLIYLAPGGNRDNSLWVGLTPIWIKNNTCYATIDGESCLTTDIKSYDKRNFKTINIYGVSFRIPICPGRFLKIAYGDNWQTPNPNYHWMKSANYKLYSEI